MRGVWVPMEHRVKQKLLEAAERDHREPKWQASMLIERALFGDDNEVVQVPCERREEEAAMQAV